MRTVNNDDFSLPIRLQRLLRRHHAPGIEIRPLATSAQDQETIFIPRRLDNSRKTLLRDPHEMMTPRRGPNRINRHLHPHHPSRS